MKSSKWLVLDDRRKIERLYAAGKSVGEIANEMGRNIATIYKELRKGYTGEMDENGRAGYSAEVAQKYVYGVRSKSRGMM
jgi:IS30 family transposase